MRTNHAGVTENAEYRIDKEKYDANFMHIFQKDKCPCPECVRLRGEPDDSPEPSPE